MRKSKLIDWKNLPLINPNLFVDLYLKREIYSFTGFVSLTNCKKGMKCYFIFFPDIKMRVLFFKNNGSSEDFASCEERQILEMLGYETDYITSPDACKEYCKHWGNEMLKHFGLRDYIFSKKR